jgi:hypothetical protein
MTLRYPGQAMSTQRFPGETVDTTGLKAPALSAYETK